MIQPIEFWVQGTPKGQPRPRAFSRGGIASVYDPGTAEGWKGQVAVACRELLPAQPMDMPLQLKLTFYIPRPKSHYRTGKRSKELREDAPSWCPKKPDADNYSKAIMDALTVLRMWVDDCQVVDLRARKKYENGNGIGCFVLISEPEL